MLLTTEQKQQILDIINFSVIREDGLGEEDFQELVNSITSINETTGNLFRHKVFVVRNSVETKYYLAEEYLYDDEVANHVFPEFSVVIQRVIGDIAEEHVKNNINDYTNHFVDGDDELYCVEGVRIKVKTSSDFSVDKENVESILCREMTDEENTIFEDRLTDEICNEFERYCRRKFSDFH